MEPFSHRAVTVTMDNCLVLDGLANPVTERICL